MKHFLFKLTFYANFAQTVFMYDLIKQIKWIDQVIEKQLQIVRNELLRIITIFMVVKSTCQNWHQNKNSACIVKQALKSSMILGY